MPVNVAVVKRLIKTAEEAHVLTLKHEGKPALPIPLDDDLADLPEHLRPEGKMAESVRSFVGFVESDDGFGETSYSPVLGLYESPDDIPEEFRYKPHFKVGSWLSAHGLNYREMVEQLVRQNPANHPSCTRVTLTMFRGSCDFQLIVHDIDAYTGIDAELARGLVVSARKLHVTDTDVQHALAGMESVGIYRYRDYDFRYNPGRASQSKKRIDRRIEKGQLPLFMVRYLLDSMITPMNKVARDHDICINNLVIHDRRFLKYVNRAMMAYPMFIKLVRSKDRGQLRDLLRAIKPYLPGMLKSTSEGRAVLAKWVRKISRKEL